jgi:hypothetical protein
MQMREIWRLHWVGRQLFSSNIHKPVGAWNLLDLLNCQIGCDDQENHLILMDIHALDYL